MFKFETLEVWKKSQQFCLEVLDDVKSLPNDYRYTIQRHDKIYQQS